MKNKQIIQPPRWAEKFLEFYCRPEVYEDLQGDLYEYFSRRVETKGFRWASFIYILDVLKFIRPYTIKKPAWTRQVRYSTMIYRNYLKTSFRSLRNSTIFSLINIIGLAVSMSVGLVLITFILELKSYDDFQANADQMYRVKNTYHSASGNESHFASTSVRAFNRIHNEVPGVESSVILVRGFQYDFKKGTNEIPLEGMYASKDFFELFSYKLIKGNPETVLEELYSIVITESAAKRLFADEDPLGKTVTSDTTEYMITGVMEDIPRNSHLDFEVLCSFNTIDQINKEDNYWLKWDNMWSNYVYMRLEEDVDKASVLSVFDRIADEENRQYEERLVSIDLDLQPYTAIIPGINLSNQPGKSMQMFIIWILIGLAIVILLSACFNYTNLSIARSLKRSREVGVRKVVGASRSQVFVQFVFESVIMALIALMLSYGLFQFIKPHFIGLDNEIANLVTMKPTAITYLYFIAFAILVGILAGFLPGIFFSRLNPLKVLKSLVTKPALKGLTFGRVLILIQFTVSLIFVIVTSIAYSQYQYAVNFDLGYETENILNLRLQGNDPELLINEFSQLNEVEGVSSSLLISSVGNYWTTQVKYMDPNDSIHVWYNSIDHKYLDLHKHSVKYGEPFRRMSEDPYPRPVLVNELLIEKLGLPEGPEAIGEMFTLDEDTVVVSGVINDFYYGTIESEIKPFLFLYNPDKVYHLNILLASGIDVIRTMERVEAVWKKIDPLHTFDAKFYDDQIQEAYASYSVMMKIVGFMATAAILIAFMGLLGMLVFTTETRMKEISVRKVLGASTQNLMLVVGKTYIILLIIATLIAVPITYLVFSEVLLSEVANKASITVVELGAGVFAILILAIGAILVQTLKAVGTNPAKTLRNE